MPGEGPNYGALLGIGSEMLVGVVAGWFGGEWIDKRFSCSPWGTMIGTLLGVAAGMYLLIREGIRINKGPPGPPPRDGK